jgi:hypothetical protein
VTELSNNAASLSKVTQTQSSITGVFRGFSQILEADAKTVTENRSLNLFQFLINESSNSTVQIRL